MKRHFAPSIAFAVLLLTFATGCPSNVANDTPARQLVREATVLNKVARATYDAVFAAHAAGAISDARLVALEPYADAAEAGRKQLTADALAGNVSKFDATRDALLAAVGELSAALLEAKPRPRQPVVPAPAPESEPTPPGPPQ